jgi:hypothetical protein
MRGQQMCMYVHEGIQKKILNHNKASLNQILGTQTKNKIKSLCLNLLILGGFVYVPPGLTFKNPASYI